MSEENKLRVVIDTNLVISGTISPNGIPSQLLTSWAIGDFNWILTEHTYDEIKDVLERDTIKNKYHIDEAETKVFLDNLAVCAEFIIPIPEESLSIHVRDPKDDKFLACALGGNCDYLITGDEDLLILNGKSELGKLQIVKAAEFLNRKT